MGQEYMCGAGIWGGCGVKNVKQTLGNKQGICGLLRQEEHFLSFSPEEKARMVEKVTGIEPS